MTDRLYIIDPSEARGSTLGLLPGLAFWKTQLVRGGPWVAVKTEVVEPRNDAGEVDGDCTYMVWIDGAEVPWDRWKSMTLIGETVTEAQYNYLLKALDWDRRNLGLDERKAVDLMAMPPIAPPAYRRPVILPPEDGPMALADTPAASALADKILPPIDVEIPE